MSRIGKKPLKLPQGVTVTAASGSVVVKGPKATITMALPAGIAVAVQGGSAVVTRSAEGKSDRACHGMVRSTLENHIAGVVAPYSRTLDIQGVGFQAALKGGKLGLKVGFANEVVMEVPKGLQLDLPSATRIIVSGSDKQLVGEFAARVRRVRPPEPYNGKGIRYENEQVERKAGKTFTSAG
jgi:large subunit ribosomal protein L6